MAKFSNRGPRLDALLDERDHLRIQVSLADNSGHGNFNELKDARLRLAVLDEEIDDHWSSSPNAKKRIAQRAAEHSAPSAS